MLNSFWWGHNSANSRGLHWLSWERLSVPKVFGGMGVKGLKAFNMAMVGKQAWKLVSSPESLITRLLKAKYFPRSDYFGASIGHNPTYVWRSIWSAKDVIRRGFQWSIGTGEHIPVWDHPWISNVARILPSTHHQLEWPSIIVSDLLITPQKQWNMELINTFFDSIFQPMCLLSYNTWISSKSKFFSVTLWSIWKHRNNKVLNNITDTAQDICARAGSLLTSWRNAQNIWHPSPQNPSTPNDLKWVKPSPGRFTCNVDASLSQAQNRVGIGVCIRDEEGCFVLAKTEWMTPLLDVELGEALGLLSAMHWVRDLQLGIVDFELDSKSVVDSLYGSTSGVSNFSAIINDCRRLLASDLVTSNVRFIRRQANEFAHSFAIVALRHASFHIHIRIPSCISTIILNEMQ
ncbi:uncharacterized protein [Medicago truncatula]|uniref:uncharacterized protein n=1 Tax=Medicago truncatula TaxID=3880 RepID=UPI0019676BDD|nr:uncharacterized protein LOC120577825 [Medicago truncatula]